MAKRKSEASVYTTSHVFIHQIKIHIRCYNEKESLKSKYYIATIIVKSVGKVAFFTSSFPPSPRPWPNVDENVNVCACNCSVILNCSVTLNSGDGGYLAKEKTLFFQD